MNFKPKFRLRHRKAQQADHEDKFGVDPKVCIQDSKGDRIIIGDGNQKSSIACFVEVAKYFSNPKQKCSTYHSELRLVSYPTTKRVDYKIGGIVTNNIKFTNLTLEPVYVKLFKVTPKLEQIKYINLSHSHSKRVPPGLSFNLGFLYDDVLEKKPKNATMVFVATKKTNSQCNCYQVCEIQLEIVPPK